MNAQRRDLFKLAGAAVAFMPALVFAAESGEENRQPKEAAPAAGPSNDLMTVIRTRRSVREYTNEPVSQADLDIMLEAAMMAPSAANEQPWDFVVIQDPETLNKIGEINHYASYAQHAPLAILVCLNIPKVKIKSNTSEKNKGKNAQEALLSTYGMAVLDVGMASENLMLAARGLGLGSVFTGIFPMEDRMKAFQGLVGLPENVIPMGLIIIGHTEAAQNPAPDRFKKENIHQDKWTAKS